MSLTQFDFDTPSKPPPLPIGNKQRTARHVNILTAIFCFAVVGGIGISLAISYRAEVANDEAAQREHDAKRQAAKRTAPVIPSGDILKAYSDNAVRAKHVFENKYLIVEGIIDSVDSGLGSLFVSLEDGGLGLTCYFPKVAVRQVAGLSAGERVSIFGKCDGMTIGIITMHECEVVR